MWRSHVERETMHDRNRAVKRYVVLEEIGRGGMGRVLRAYDPKLQREVALKLVRSETLGPAGARRLVAEARAMAKLSHPNVVSVYDVEEIDDEQVVLVMEYVAGQTLTAWLQTPRSWPQIVACFRQAGRGLAAAHAAGLLHRDFKPDNVLVGEQTSGSARVRVTDFGLARELVAPVTDELEPVLLDGTSPVVKASAARTAAGTIVGTLPYLAPERLVGAPADAATDQFAFCVSLWESLFGERPFAGGSVVELAFAMSAGPPRPPPSAPRLPAWLMAAIIRGLDGDPAKRWPDLQALLAELALAPGRRRRRWLRTAAAIGVLGTGAAAVQLWSTTRARRCTEAAAIAHLQDAWDGARREQVERAVLGTGAAYAMDAWTRSERALEAYASAWTRMHVETCAATALRGEQSTAVLDLRMACLQRADVELGAVTRVLAQADAQTVQKADQLVGSLPPLERCADVDALQAEVEPPRAEEAVAVESARGDIALARAELRAGHYDEAEQALDAATATLADVGYGPVQTELALERGYLLERRGEYEAARTELREALRRAAKWRQWNELQTAAGELVYVVGHRLQRFDEGLRYAEVARGLAAGDPDREATIANSVAIVLQLQGKSLEAEAEARRAIALGEAARGPDDPELPSMLETLANILHSRQEFTEADELRVRVLALRERDLGPEHPRVATSRNNYAASLQAQGKLDEALVEHRKALAIRERVLGPEHPDVAQSLNNIAVILQTQGELAAAELAQRRVIGIRVGVLGAQHPEVAGSRHNLAANLAAQGRFGEAEAEQRLALEVWAAALGPAHAHVALAHHNLASHLSAGGKRALAEAEYRRALALRVEVLGPDDPETAETHHNLGNVLEAQGKHAEAVPEYRLALASWSRSLGVEHPYIPMTQTNLAIALVGTGELAEAHRLLELAWTRAQRDDIGAPQRAATAFALARVHLGEGEPARAIELAERALAFYAAMHAGDGDEAKEVRSWLAQHSRP